jgi:hypothetical protein
VTYPQIIEYNEAVQNPAQAFIDPELKKGTVRENALGLPLVLSGGFALTYTVETPQRKCAVRCFHREIPSIEQKYAAISRTLRPLANGYFVNFDFQKAGINVRNGKFPIVRMDWVDGDPLGVWLDKNYQDAGAIEVARTDFFAIACFLEQEGIAHGDIQNGNVMMSKGRIRLIDYDGMFVPGMATGHGTETGHKHFQHPDRQASDFGPKMDRFSFIALDLSLQGVIADKSLYPKFREGGETIIFRANDFVDPQNSEVFRMLMAKPKLKNHAQHFAAICQAPISAVPSLEDYLAGRNIPAVKVVPIKSSSTAQAAPQPVGYISAHPIVDALDFNAAMKRVGDRVELVGKIVEVKRNFSRRGRRPYVFINFGAWRGSIVKISIWSEGLAELREQPSAGWVGRWVSVVGLMDPPYESQKYGYRHLSVTVEKDGQIQFLNETQARFRLASIGKTPKPRNRDVVKEILDRRETWTSPGDGAPPQQSSSTRQPQSPPHGANTTKTRNTEIVDRFKQANQTQPGSGYTPPSATPRPSTSTGQKGLLERIPWWVWVGGAVALLLFLSGGR